MQLPLVFRACISKDEDSLNLSTCLAPEKKVTLGSNFHTSVQRSLFSLADYIVLTTKQFKAIVEKRFSNTWSMHRMYYGAIFNSLYLSFNLSSSNTKQPANYLHINLLETTELNPALRVLNLFYYCLLVNLAAWAMARCQCTIY